MGVEHKGPELKSLDYGAGDGSVGKIIQDEIKNQITGADIMPPEKTAIPVQKITPGEKLPWKDSEFNTSFIINLLHHVPPKAQEEILDELSRVTGKGLYVIETTTDDKANSHERTLVSDYFSNRILRNEAFGSKDIPVPGTFKKPEEWNKEFKDRGLEVKNQETSNGPDRKKYGCRSH